MLEQYRSFADRANFNTSDLQDIYRRSKDYMRDNGLQVHSTRKEILRHMIGNKEGRSLIFTWALNPEVARKIFIQKLDADEMRELVYYSWREIYLPLAHQTTDMRVSPYRQIRIEGNKRLNQEEKMRKAISRLISPSQIKLNL